jgi:hypothetical protein
MISYKSKLFKVDPDIGYNFNKSIVVFTSSFDSSGKSQHDLNRLFFKGTSPVFAKTILNRFQNNVRINEERLITFCHQSMAIDVVIPDLN